MSISQDEQEPEVTEGDEMKSRLRPRTKGKQFRLRQNKSEELAFLSTKANPNLSLKEAITQAEAILGIGTEFARLMTPRVLKISQLSSNLKMKF